MLASGSSNGDVKIWNYTNGTIIKLLKNQTQTIRALKLSKFNNDYLASGSTDNSLSVWNISSYEVLFKIPATSDVVAVEFVNETLLVFGFSSSINFLDLFNGNILFSKQNTGSVISLLMLNGLLATGTNQNSWCYTNFNEISQSFNLKNFIQQQLKKAVQIDDENVAMIDEFYSYTKWDMTLTSVHTVSSSVDYHSIDAFENETIAIGNSNFQIELWNFYDDRKFLNWNAHSSYINAIKYLSIRTLLPSRPRSTTTTKTTTTRSTTTKTTTTTTTAKNTITTIQAQTTKNVFQTPVISLSSVFSSMNMNSINISQLLDNLQNKSFSFDLSQPSSQLPTSLLTSPKYDISNCVSNCSNQGLCKLNGVKFECQCDLEFTGSKCETDLRPCSNNPCLNFIKCENIQNGTQLNQDYQRYENYYPDFICSCKDNYFGKRCESKINLCQNETCSGNGICKVITNEAYQNESIKCECFGLNSFEGKKCEKKSTKMVVYEASVKTSTYVAIAVMIALSSMVIFSDIHGYFITQPSNGIKKKRVNKNRTYPNKTETKKVVLLN